MQCKNTAATPRHINRWKTRLDSSIRMEISTIVLLFQAAWKFQYGFQQIIDHVSFLALAMPSCFVSWIPIGHCFQRDHPLNLRPNLLWSASYYGIYGRLKISTPCQQWSNVWYPEGLLSMCKMHCFGAHYCLVYQLIYTCMFICQYCMYVKEYIRY